MNLKYVTFRDKWGRERRDVRWGEGYKGSTFGLLLGVSYTLQSVFIFSKPVWIRIPWCLLLFQKAAKRKPMALALVCRSASHKILFQNVFLKCTELFVLSGWLQKSRRKESMGGVESVWKPTSGALGFILLHYTVFPVFSKNGDTSPEGVGLFPKSITWAPMVLLLCPVRLQKPNQCAWWRLLYYKNIAGA